MKIILKSILSILIVLSSVWAVEDVNASNKNKLEITKVNDELKIINDTLKDNIWISKYKTYLTYRGVEEELSQTKSNYKKNSLKMGSKYKEIAYQLKNKIKIKENEKALLSEYKESPIGDSIKPKDIPVKPKVNNPFNILEAYTYIQKLEDFAKDYEGLTEELSNLVKSINSKIDLYKKLYVLNGDFKTKLQLNMLEKQLRDFVMVVDIVATTNNVYKRKISQVILEVKESISSEVSHLIKLSIIIGILLVIVMLSKMAMKKYIEDDDRFYTSNKLINVFFIIIVIFILLFSYIDNASYLVTVLGFASAGIAIALKDWFMSMFGWISIMLSGSINPGDRVKVTRNGVEVVGDVLDITLLKIAIREDTTLTSYSKNRRTGRVFFIPNNYVFTDMIANYTFDGLRTVWDVVDINITFDSNHKKAVTLARGVVTAHAKAYTDLARKRLQKMRKKYVLRNSNPEPRIFSFAESYGITISSWFHTNSHATLGLRSTIGMEILEAFKAEDDITIAYPTQSINITSNTHVAGKLVPPPLENTGNLFD